MRALEDPPDVLIADATGRDHPRRAGLAVHLGAVLGIPTIGVTHRTLEAEGEWPEAERGAHAPLMLDGEVVGAWLRIQPRARPIAVHAGWRTDAETAAAVVMSVAQPGADSGAAAPGPPRGAAGAGPGYFLTGSGSRRPDGALASRKVTSPICGLPRTRARRWPPRRATRAARSWP